MFYLKYDFISVLLLVLPLLSIGAPRVLLIGLDGLNPSCISNTSFFDYFIQNGSYTYKAKSTIQAWSSTGWSSLLCSLESIDSGILDNYWTPYWLEPNNKETQKISSIEGDKPLNCIFEILKRQNNAIRTGFYYDWDWLEYFGNKYIGGTYIDDEFSCTVDDFVVCDEIIKNMFTNKIENITSETDLKNDFDFFFLYLGSIDYIGHEKGWCGEDYQNQIKEIDQYIRKIITNLQEKGLLENTYILLTSDHGASVGAYNHGEQNDENLLIPFFAMGPEIKKNHEIVNSVYLIDIAPTVVKMMSLKKYHKWRGKVVSEIFENYQGEGFLEKCVEDRKF